MYSTECSNNFKEKKEGRGGGEEDKTPKNNKSYIEIYHSFFQVKVDNDCLKIDRRNSVHEEEFKILTCSQQLKDSTVKRKIDTKKMVIDEIKKRRLNCKQRN